MKLAVLVPLILALSPLEWEVARPLPKAGGLPLPAASGPLTFEPGTKEIGLDELVLRLAELTGQELAMDARCRQVLSQVTEPLEITASIPKEEVYSFVEGLLVRNDLVIAPITGGTRPILGVNLAGNDGRVGSFMPLYVESAALGELAAHPALHVRVLLHFKNIDSRQLQTQLRQLLVDNTGTSQCVPAGEAGLILQGRGSDIEALARLLMEADKAAGEHSLTRPEAVEAPKPGPKGPEGPKKEGEGRKL